MTDDHLESAASDGHHAVVNELRRLRALVLAAANIPVMQIRYDRGELSWANTLNEYWAGVEETKPGASKPTLSL